MRFISHSFFGSSRGAASFFIPLQELNDGRSRTPNRLVVPGSIYGSCFDNSGPKGDQTLLQIQLGPDGLRLHACTPEIAIIHALGGPPGQEVFTFPAKRLAEFEGRNAESVEIALARPDLAVARWSERSHSRELEIPLLEPESFPAPPALPTEFMPLPPHFLSTLDQASTFTAREATKYVLNRVQLRGKAGTVVASDSRQLFQAGGFNFPFTPDLLMPRCGIFGLPHFAGAKEVGIGRTNSHIAIRIGTWTFAFLIDAAGRFPDVVSIIPRPSSTSTRLRLDAGDAQRFLDNLVRRIKGAAGQGTGRHARSCRHALSTLRDRRTPLGSEIAELGVDGCPLADLSQSSAVLAGSGTATSWSSRFAIPKSRSWLGMANGSTSRCRCHPKECSCPGPRRYLPR